ncbi:Alpha-D-phosphohexomutase, conserved site [Phytophthora cactorum]|nr:Alpha-D-phosphohexomutase, conserved site [Phytophthora cactorum]
MSTRTDEQWLAEAQQWADWDVNAGTKAQLEQLVAAKDVARIRELFGSRVAFGTAGLRAVMGPGPAAMNDLVVIEASQGICKYLTQQFGDRAKSMGVALGYDHRQQGTLSSKRFAELTAAVCLHYGFKVYLYEGFVATPLVPFCIEQKGCAAGVMVTASHNPKADNGYKVYWSNGSQIVPPHDEEDLIKAFPTLIENPREELTERYFERARASLCRFPEANANTTLKIAYTAMHGVGHAFTSRSFAAFGHKEYVPVQAQLLPDPEFPTVAFPNPEEGKGALLLAMETAEANGARLILANDPDADRLAVAERDPSSRSGWRIFTVPTLEPDCDRKQLYFIASTVSSKMLRAVADAEGLNFEETLTGFKWMGNKTAELRDAGKTVLFSFEEAIGFCVGDLVKDKDGVVAAAVFAEMAVQLEATKKMTVGQHLNALYERYGHFVTQNHYVKCYDPVKIRAIFERLRNNGKYWESCGDFAITHLQPDKRAVLPVSSSTEMITYTFANGCVATLRTSGTEPKLKYYVELAGRVEQIVELMLQPKENGLELPPADK